MTTTCHICKSSFKDLRGLSCHRAKRHSDISEEEFATTLFGCRPTCACGCGQHTTFVSLTKGWSQYVKGHNGFTQEARHLAVQQSIASRRECGSWNRGLTKHDDTRVAKQAKTVSQTLRKKYELGEIVPWQSGHTKDTNTSIAKMSDTKVRQWASGELKTWTQGLTKFTSQKLNAASHKISRKKRENYESANRIPRDELLKRIQEHSTSLNFDVSQLDDYRARRQTRMKFTCTKCGDQQIKTLAMLEESPQCWKCAPKDSQGQREVAEYIRHLLVGVDIKTNDRTIISPKELDIYVQQKSFAVEYNGLFYHCEDIVPKDHHLKKRSLTSEKGIRLFNIFEDEWKNENKREIIKSMLCERLGINTTIPARKTKVEEVNKDARKAFFNDNHIDGDVPAVIAFGLYIDDRLVSCMSLRKPLSKKWHGHIEIARAATVKCTRVVGGLGKLMKYVKDWSASMGYEGILTYVDLRYGDGHGYEKVGFQKVNFVKNFWWTDMTRRFDRSYCTATSGITEKQNAQMLGLRKIWGWGHSSYILPLTGSCYREV